MGELFKDGQSRPVTWDELALYEQAQILQALQQVPVLQHANNPHQYLFFALFDGTGQDANDPAQLLTNVGHVYRQTELLARNPHNRLGYMYVEGIGTQDHPLARLIDGLVAHTWDEKIELAYRALAEQARNWQQQDPAARISIVGVGYSRGAVLDAGFARLVDRYGIADPEDLAFGRDAHGNITIESSRPALVPPGRTAQAAALLDPVGTNLPPGFDARLPPSVISRFALAAADERRTAFPHQPIVAPGISDDRRAVNALVPGGHANTGGGTRVPGLETVAFNLLVDHLNGLRDRPLFAYRQLPDDPALYTVYQVRGPTAVPGMDRDGRRDVRMDLASCKVVDPCRDSEPVDEALAAKLEFRTIKPSAPMPRLAALPDQPAPDRQASAQLHATRPPSDPAHPDHGTLLQIRSGVRAIDQGVGKDYDDASERLSRSLLAASKDNRDMHPQRTHAPLATSALDRVDHVLLGTDGRNAFIVQGAMHDPAHRRVRVDVATAISTPVELSDARLEAANQQIARQLELARQQTRGHVPDDVARAVPAL